MQSDFVNPIDEKKVTQTPHILPYAHTVGSAVIRPIDRGKVTGLAVAAMYEQTDMQLAQIRKQVELLAAQAQEIQQRVDISERIYKVGMNFKPLISHVYHLYTRPDGSEFLSMIAPTEWGRGAKISFQASVKLLADHTWEILKNDE
jgi:Protein of unknown function (DUF2452)